MIYGACFGLELTIDNVAALYFVDSFHLLLKMARLVAGLFGRMNLFARALGAVAGIVGAGGNLAAMMAGFLFKSSISWPQAFLILGILVTLSSGLAFVIRFSEGGERITQKDVEATLVEEVSKASGD